MNKIREKFGQFMLGRYGIDQLYYALLVLYIACVIINAVLGNVLILGLLMWVILIIAFFRVFSRNTYKRSRENEVFLGIWNQIKNFFVLNYSKVRDCRTKKYSKCPHCHAVLRLPRQRGTHTVKCPKCGNRFEIKIILGAKSSHHTTENKHA